MDPNRTTPPPATPTPPPASPTPGAVVAPPTPITTPAAAPVAPARPPINAGLIILQWLTYAFWGWTVLALSALTVTVLSSFITDADVGGFTPYGIAAVLVLLPISFACDYYYSKREPEKKTGAESVVMIIHAVAYALFAIGALITAVFAMVQILTNASDVASEQVFLYSAIIISVFYLLTFLRTFNPAKLPWAARYYKLFMLLAVGLISILAIVGPVAKERTTRNDKLLESGLSTLTTDINSYATNHSSLPTTLSVLGESGDAKQILDKNLVDYKPQFTAIPQNTTYNSYNTVPIYHYQLCVSYAAESTGYKQADDLSRGDYSTLLDTYNHPAGNVCYKVATSGY